MASQSSSFPSGPQFAGNANQSCLSPPAALHSSHFNDLWCVDTGATSHMTPPRHWLKNYKPLRLPVRLANNTVVYSAGVGSVLFIPEIEGRKLQAVEFSNVLHVPELGNNLFSVLYLTCYKQFSVVILETVMNFVHSGKVWFTAAVNSSNCAYLKGSTQVNPTLAIDSALSSSTLPLDTTLWHQRLCHHHYNGLEWILKQKLVSGLVIESQSVPDPICKPCLAGKVHANPFPSSQSQSSCPLQLIHTDVHGPLPVRTHSGFQYWVTFIDNYTQFHAVFPMKAKSDTFEAFKAFKA